MPACVPRTAPNHRGGARAGAGMSGMAPPAGVRWLPDFIILAAIWGSSFLFMQLGTQAMGPLPTAGVRVAIAALFLLPVVLLRGQGRALLQHWKITFAVGLINSALPFACFTYALQSISTGLSAILNATVPLFGALVAWAWFGDRPDRSRVLGLALGFAGIAMLAWDKASFRPDANGFSSGAGVLACLLACLCYGLAASATRRYMGGVPSLVAATGSQIGASLALLPLAWLTWPAHAVPPWTWGALLVLGVLCTGVAYILYFRLIARAGPARTLTVTFGIPVFALLYGVLLLGERVTAWMALCGLVVIAGTALAMGLLRLPGTQKTGGT